MMELIVLGKVPGTQFVVTYELLVLAVTALIALILLTYEIKLFIHRRKQVSTPSEETPSSLQVQA